MCQGAFLLLLILLLVSPLCSQAQTYKGYEVKLISVKRTGQSEWKWGGVLPFRAKKGGEIVVIRVNFKALEPGRQPKVKFKRMTFTCADGKVCGESLMRDLGVVASHEFEIPFEAPRSARLQSVNLEELSFDLEKLESSEAKKP